MRALNPNIIFIFIITPWILYLTWLFTDLIDGYPTNVWEFIK